MSISAFLETKFAMLRGILRWFAYQAFYPHYWDSNRQSSFAWRTVCCWNTKLCL
jgi:hypothetical protein